MKKTDIRKIVRIAMFAAVMAVLSQIALPLPSGVPITLQTFAIALAAASLSCFEATAATLVYVLLGLVGMPVFSFFGGGIGKFLSPSGGFIYGFIPFVYLCACGAKVIFENKKSLWVGIILSAAGLAACHLCGVLHFSFVCKTPLLYAFLTASAPYIIKDIISVAIAFAIGKKIRKRISS